MILSSNRKHLHIFFSLWSQISRVISLESFAFTLFREQHHRVATFWIQVSNHLHYFQAFWDSKIRSKRLIRMKPCDVSGLTSLGHQILFILNDWKFLKQILDKDEQGLWQADELIIETQIIVLRDNDKSRFFAITEFYNCFIIRSPRLFSHLNRSRRAQGNDLPLFSHKSVITITHEQINLYRQSIFIGHVINILGPTVLLLACKW